jgi:cephalosporin-C deacetylase
MPLAAIESFTPLVNVPSDFDEFWDSTVDALHGVDAGLQLDEQTAPAQGLRHDKLRFKSFGNVEISGYLLQHEDSKPRPLVVHSHGYNSQHDVMLNWANRGCHVMGIDFRGFGRSQPVSLARGGYVLTGLDSPATSILRGAVMDLFRAAELGQSLVAEKLSTTTLYGFSFGGGMAVMASAFGAPADLLVVGQPTLGWHSERLRLSTAGSSDEINRFLVNAPGERDTVMASLAYFDTLHFASRLQTPALIGIGLDDHVVPSRSVIAIANHVTDPRLEVRVLPVAHSDDPRESLWSVFDDEWLDMSVKGIPGDYGDLERQVRTIDQ